MSNIKDEIAFQDWAVALSQQVEVAADLRAQLEASQASEARLREALRRLVSWKQPVELCAPDLGGLRLAMYEAEAFVNSTEADPITAVVEAARAWANNDTPYPDAPDHLMNDLLLAIAALDKPHE